MILLNFLPTKFLDALIARVSDDGFLEVKEEVVAEAFMSIDDHLVIVYSGNESPGIHAPCAIFVDLGKSKEEIMGVLFPGKGILCVQKPSNNEAPSSSTSPCNVELQMNWKVVEDVAEAIYGAKGLALNTLSGAAVIKKELDRNIGTLATALANKQFCAGKDATVVHAANLANDDLKLLSSAFTSSTQNVEHSAVMSVVERVQSSRPKIDDFLSKMGQIHLINVHEHY